MRREVWWALAALIALGAGVLLAQPFARLAAPYYAAVARLAAIGHPWKVTAVGVREGRSHLTSELTLEAEVKRSTYEDRPLARVRGRVQVGEVVETPLLFWTLLMLWPAAGNGQRLRRVLVGLPFYLLLEAVTTASQLVLPMAQASAILAGSQELTPWDRWSQFLEAGGQFVLACGTAIVVVALAGRLSPRCATLDAAAPPLRS
jgi:hypothetical protein